MPGILEQFTLAGALATAVVVLWRKIEEKDKQILEALRILERSAEANERSAEATLAIVSAMEKLRNALPLRKRESPEPSRNIGV